MLFEWRILFSSRNCSVHTFHSGIRRLRLAVHAALPSLLRIGCRHPSSREDNEELILDQRGIRSTHYVPGESWFGDECAHCLFREWRYSSHRIQSGRCTSLFRGAAQNTRGRDPNEARGSLSQDQRYKGSSAERPLIRILKENVIAVPKIR